MVSSQTTGKLVRELKAETPPAGKDTLSPREREILMHLAKGSRNQEISRRLALAESTVKIHVQPIVRKLSLSSRGAGSGVHHRTRPGDFLRPGRFRGG